MYIVSVVICFVFGIIYIATAENQFHISIAAIYFFLADIYTTLSRIDKGKYNK